MAGAEGDVAVDDRDLRAARTAQLNTKNAGVKERLDIRAGRNDDFVTGVRSRDSRLDGAEITVGTTGDLPLAIR